MCGLAEADEAALWVNPFVQRWALEDWHASDT